MRQLILLFLVLAGVIFFAAWSSKPGNLNKYLTNQIPSVSNPSPSPTNTKTAKVGNSEINVEIVKTSEEREQGLSGRDKIEDNSGMLFVFDRQNIRPAFWMKNVKFPLDIVWIKSGKVAQINKNLMPIPQGTPDSQIKLYLPNQSVDYVLELPGGKIDRAGIKVGDPVQLPPL